MLKFSSFVSSAVATFTLVLACVLPAQAQTVNNAVLGQGTWETTLLGRDINLNAVSATDASAVYLYDKTLDITWLRDANANVTGNAYADANATTSGLMNWFSASAWAQNLVVGSGAKAISDWRLPVATQGPTIDWTGGVAWGYNLPGSASEMASLYFNTLGNKSYYDTSGNIQAGWGMTNTGSFQNMQAYGYWSSTEFGLQGDAAWNFITLFGRQDFLQKAEMGMNAMAVRDGDVAAVPEPETYSMLLAGLGLLGMVGKRRNAKPRIEVGRPVS